MKKSCSNKRPEVKQTKGMTNQNSGIFIQNTFFERFSRGPLPTGAHKLVETGSSRYISRELARVLYDACRLISSVRNRPYTRRSKFHLLSSLQYPYVRYHLSTFLATFWNSLHCFRRSLIELYSHPTAH